VSFAVFAMCGCPQSPLGSNSSSSSSASGTGNTNGTGNTTSTNGPTTTNATTTATTGTNATSSTNSGTTGTTGNPNCPESGSNSPSLNCALAEPNIEAVADQSVEIDCTVGAGESATYWEASASPQPGYVDSHELLTHQKAWVTYRSNTMPTLFADTTATLSVTAHFCQNAPSTTQVSFPVVGNTLIADPVAGIRSFTSSGAEVAAFIGPALASGATMVMQMSNGNFLVGCQSGAANCTKPLQAFDGNGNLLSSVSFDTLDPQGNALWPTGMAPWAAIEDGQGNIWVSANKGRDYNGSLLIFSTDGAYTTTAAKPSDPNNHLSYWVPMGLVKLADGTIVVAAGGTDSPWVAEYTSPTSSALVQLSTLNCTDPGGGGNPQCQTASDTDTSLAGLYLRGSTLIATSGWAFETAEVSSYATPGLAAQLASVIPSSGNAFYEASLGPVVPLGTQRYLIGSLDSLSCVRIVDATTLYIPADWTDPNSGCWLNNNGSSQLGGMWHLGQ
jgi:hypothetical protein